MKKNSEIRNEWFISKVADLKAQGITQSEIAQKLGVVPQYLTPIINGTRNASENLIVKLSKAFLINQNDLLKKISEANSLMPEDEIAQQDKEVAEGKWIEGVPIPQYIYDSDAYQSLYKAHTETLKEKAEIEKVIRKVPEGSNKGIPLIPIDAMAGFGGGDMQVMEYECERYVIPMFRDAEFLISVKGSSMYPKYNSGDLVACRKVPLDTFFQWNKVYVLDTEQGALIKRIKKGSDKNHITLVSDNNAYEPFELHLEKIYAISIVVGVCRLE